MQQVRVPDATGLDAAASDDTAPDALELPFTPPPTHDELPYDDGMPMPTFRHVLQMSLLMETLRLHWPDRPDVFIGGDMFIYYSPLQLLNEDFRGPDFFVVLDTPIQRERKSWVIWEEGKGPDLVVELLSESTARSDKTAKKQVYQDNMRVPEYVWYDPYTYELAGFALRDGAYEPMQADEEGRLISRRLGLLLVRWEGEFRGEEATWLRWATPDGAPLPTGAELAARERARAEAARAQADAERQRAERAEQQLAELQARLARLEAERQGEPGPGA
jgi:Uma2 family endonuclease